ncbi:hypothetical protein [Alteromonas sp. 14N.309.X.WAT.G.H12]|uniref:hypothetical protein n=1 Tax=Alteromonas sp. 14N.309.X.WAT.G.H12 TaxID=3120824 RepID=UPI002FD237EB
MSTSKDLHALCQQPLHGVHLSVDGSPSPALPYEMTVKNGPITPLENEHKIWSLVDRGERYTSTVSLFRYDDTLQLSIDCEGVGIFEFKHNTLTIDWQSGGTGPAHYLQTLGISLYLERQHKICLHANTLVKNGNAYLFLAPSRTGKSTLTSAMTALDYQLITDDMAAIYPNGDDYKVYPSWPKVRLWPDSAKHLAKQLTTDNHAKKKVHARFAKEEINVAPAKAHKPHPVKGLYLLNRKEDYHGPVTLSMLPPSHGVIYLLQNSMLGDAYTPLGLDKARMISIARLLQKVTFYEVTYPSGLAHLDDVTRALDEQLSTT